MRVMQIIFLNGVSEACSSGFTAAYIRSCASLLPPRQIVQIGRAVASWIAAFFSMFRLVKGLRLKIASEA